MSVKENILPGSSTRRLILEIDLVQIWEENEKFISIYHHLADKSTFVAMYNTDLVTILGCQTGVDLEQDKIKKTSLFLKRFDGKIIQAMFWDNKSYYITIE